MTLFNLRALEPVARAAATSGLSGLSVLFGSLVPGRVEPLSDPALEQARWFEAVARLLERIQDAAPTLLFVDDVHEADGASLALLHYLCRRLQGPTRRRPVDLRLRPRRAARGA